MIKRKKKKCLDCKEDKIIFGKNLCQNCYNINYRKPIKKISDRQKRILNSYNALRRDYLQKNPICEAKIKCNGFPATDIHHKAGKATEELYLDTSKWMSLCRECHRYIEENPTEAKSLGFSLTRTNK